jgi:hypothetical protein
VPIAPERSVTHLPATSRRDVHLSLHSSGRINLRAHACEPITVDHFGAWLPVRSLLRWVYFYSDPFDRLPLAGKIRRRDALVEFPHGDASAELHLDVIPPVQPYPLKNRAAHTVIGLVPPHFGLRVSVFHCRPMAATLFFASSNPALEPSAHQKESY